MCYLKLAWDHDLKDEPICLYSDCDPDGWEVRKVEVFQDGRLGYASREIEVYGSRLDAEPIPAPSDIAKQKDFRPTEITELEFDRIWEAAQTKSRIEAVAK